MASGYTRQSEANIQPGLPIQSGDFNGEFDQLEAAFDGTLGHNHSGGTGLGSKINLTGAAGVTGTLPTFNGGTNATSWTTGSIPYLSSATQFAQDNANLFWNATNHRLGIGTTGPACKLEIAGSAASQLEAFRISGTTTAAQYGNFINTGSTLLVGIESSVGGALSSGSSAYAGIISQVQGTSLQFGTSNIIRMTLYSNGAFSVGNATTNGYTFSCITNSGAPPTSAFLNTHNTAGDENVRVGSGPNSADSTSSLLKFYDSGVNTVQGSITRNGAAAVAFNTTSDARLKENIKDTELGIEALMNINVRDFNFIGEKDHTQQGMIAQELYNIYPSAVHAPSNPDAELKMKQDDEVKVDPWGIDYGRLTPLIIKSLQDLYKTAIGKLNEATIVIADLEARLTLLEAK